MLNEEYGFAMDDMERDFTIAYEDSDRGRNKKFKAGLVVFYWEKEHNQDNSSLFAHIPTCFLLFLQSSNILTGVWRSWQRASFGTTRPEVRVFSPRQLCLYVI